MFADEIWKRFLDEAPVCVMLRATLENLLPPRVLDELFEQHAQQQYERELLFSSVVELMSRVVCRVSPSVHAASQRQRESIPVAIKSLSNKLSGIEPQVCRALVQHTARSAGGGFLVIRQHLGHLSRRLKGPRRYRGRTETGRVYEQAVELTHPRTGEQLVLRRITIQLDQPTRDGDTELHLLTSLAPRAATADDVAQLYRKRWTVETAFQQLTTTLRCELTSLGYVPTKHVSTARLLKKQKPPS